MAPLDRAPRDYALRMAGLAHAGFDRHANEDAVGCFDQRLAVVVDSNGGNASGAFVPPVILSVLRGALRGARAPDDAPVADLVAAAFARAHETYRATAAAVGAAMLGAGAVVGALWLSGTRGAFAHVGDTRCYRWRDGALTQMGREHSLAREFLRANPAATDDERAALAQYSNVVTRAFYAEGPPEPELIELDLRAGDRYLLCSDGLWRSLDEGALSAHLREGAALDATLGALMAHGLAAPSGDNLSAVLAEVCVLADDGAPRAPPSPRRDDATLAVEALRGRRWRPAERNDDAVRACLDGHTQVAEAWEALASRGVIPLRWTDAPTRRFLAGSHGESMPRAEAVGFVRALVAQGAVVTGVAKAREGWLHVQWRTVAALPPSLAAVARLACDVDGVERAEGLVDEAASRLRPFGYASPERHVWTFADARTRRDARWPIDLQRDALAALCDVTAPAPNAWPEAVPRLADGAVDVVKRLCDGDDAWSPTTPFAVPRWSAARGGHPYADLPSPLRPLREIVALGYLAAEVGLWGRVLMAADG